MRILHVTDSYLPTLGGIESEVSGLAREQRRAGDDARVLTSTPAFRGQHGRSVAEDEHGVGVYRLTARVPGHFPIHPWPLAHARRLLGQLRPDVLHLHIGGLTPTTQAVLARFVGRVPTVVTVHSVWDERVTRPFYTGLDTVVGWSRWPTVFTSVSELAAGRVRQAARGRTPVHVLRNGVDVSRWLGDPANRPARGPEEPVHAVTAGRFVPRKRMLPLLAALRQARELLPPHLPLRVTLAGEGPELAQAQTYVRDNAMAWVELVGRLTQTELVALYRDADIYLAPGTADAFSVAVQEAQAAGLAIVSREQSGAAELLTDGVEGLLAADDDALARAVARLVRDRELLSAITRRNRTVPPGTAWPTVIAATRDIYRLAGA
ncbi:MAG: glycosyltransferase family 4 protein [Georgenia sp.]